MATLTPWHGNLNTFDNSWMPTLLTETSTAEDVLSFLLRLWLRSRSGAFDLVLNH